MGNGSSSEAKQCCQHYERDSLHQHFDREAVRRRARAAVLGALVADAAAAGLDGLPPDQAHLRLTRMRRLSSPEFLPPCCPDERGRLFSWLQYKPGAQSPVGEEAAVLLDALTQHGGVDCMHLTQACYKAFRQHPGRLSSAAQQLVAHMEAGAAWPHAAPCNDHLNCLAKVPVLVARYAGKAELGAKVAQAVATCQAHPTAAACALAAALLLERVILGSTVQDALQWAASSRQLPRRMRRAVARALSMAQAHGVRRAMQKFGCGVHLPGAFQAALACATLSSDYAQAVRLCVAGGGECAGRAMFVGALFAAQGGLEAVPPEWRARTSRLAEFEALTEKLLTQRAIVEISAAP